MNYLLNFFTYDFAKELFFFPQDPQGAIFLFLSCGVSFLLHSIPPGLLFAERKTILVFVPAVFFCRDEFLPSLLSFFLSRVVIVVVVWRRSSSPRSLACSLVH